MLFPLNCILYSIQVYLFQQLFHNKFLHFENHLTLYKPYLNYNLSHNYIDYILMHLDTHLQPLYTFGFQIIFLLTKYLRHMFLVFDLTSYITFLPLLLFCLIHLINSQLCSMNRNLVCQYQ